MTKRRHPRPEAPLFGRRSEYGVYNYREKPEVHILTPEGRSAFETQFATAYTLMTICGCSIASAYRYMAQPQVRRYTVRDWSEGIYREYQAIKLSDIEKIYRHRRRGNPNFYDGSYQSELRSRRKP